MTVVVALCALAATTCVKQQTFGPRGTGTGTCEGACRHYMSCKGTKDKAVRYLRNEDNTPTIVHFDDPIDHVAIRPGLEEEVLRNSFRVHAVPDKEAWRRTYSDHFPVTDDTEPKVKTPTT